MDSVDLNDDEIKQITESELKNSIEAINYISKVQKRINKIITKIEAIDRETSSLKKEKTHLNYRLNRMESLQKLAILGTLRVSEDK
jgi:hypothetical protein